MEGKVECVAFSPDGKTLAAGVIGPATAGGVMLWDVATRKPLADKPLTVNRGFVTGGLAFSPDGKTLAAGVSADVALRGVMLWDVAGFGGGILLWDEAAPSARRLSRRSRNRDGWNGPGRLRRAGTPSRS